MGTNNAHGLRGGIAGSEVMRALLCGICLLMGTYGTSSALTVAATSRDTSLTDYQQWLTDRTDRNLTQLVRKVAAKMVKSGELDDIK